MARDCQNVGDAPCPYDRARTASNGNFTYRELAECAEREIAQRRWVYKRRCEDGKMKPEWAERQIAMMEAIAADYRQLEQETETLL